MGTFSTEFEQGLLDRVDELSKKKLELERRLQKQTGLMSARELKKRIRHNGSNTYKLG